MTSPTTANKLQPSIEVANKVEDICKQGCSQVSELLSKVENGHQIDELANFNNHEVEQIIDELSQIMSVYDDDNCAQ